MTSELTPSWFIGIDWTGAGTRRSAIAERFELSAPIGRGGSAEVWRAHDPTTERDVAIKVLVHEIARQPLFQSQLRHEVRAVSRLCHDHIVRVLDVGTLGAQVDRATEGRLVAGSPFLAMELLNGGTLIPLTYAPRPWPTVRRVLARLLSALAHAHARGVVHLDIKPSNVMRRTPADDDIVLTDFGLACFTHEPVPAGTGTLGYAAPEQLIGDGRDVGPATDLFSFGCLAWELLTTTTPFVEEDPHARAFARPRAFEPRHDVPAGVGEWLVGLLRSSPRARVGSAHEALRSLPGAPSAAELSSPGLPADWRRAHRDALGTRPSMPRSPLDIGLGLWELGVVPIVGREPERDALWAAARRAVVSLEPVLVDLVGPPGSGKSRLADWLLTRLAEADAATTLRVSASAEETLADPLRRHFRTDGLAPGRAAGRIEDALGPGWVAAEAAWVLCGETGDPSALSLLVERMSRQRALALLFDGIEPPRLRARALIVRTLERPAPPPEGFVGEHLSVPLSPLRGAAAQSLLVDVLHLGPEARGRLGATPAWPGPWLALIGKWLEAGELERHGMEHELTAASRRQTVPEEAGAVWAARLDGLARRLAEGETRALEVAAVLGSGAELRLWALAAQNAETKPTLACVDRLAMEGLGQRRDGKILFASAKVVDALKRRAAHRLRAYHHACARALEERSDVRRAAERRGVHTLRAGLDEQAAPLLLVGARARLRALDPQRALELLDLYDGVAERRERDAFDPERLGAQLLRSLCLRRAGRVEEATALAKSTHKATRKLGSPELLGRAAHLRGRLARAAGDTTAAMRYLLEAKTAAEQHGDASLVADMLVDTAVVLLSVDAAARAQGELERALEIDERPEGRAMARLLCARVARRQGDHDEARGSIEAAVAELGPGSRGLLPELWNEAGDIERGASRFEEAASYYRRALEGYVALGSAAAVTELNLGLTLIELGDLEMATTHLEGALGAWSAQGREDLAGGWALAVAFAAARGDDWEQSRLLLDRVRALDDDDWRRLHGRMAALAEAPPGVTRRLVELAGPQPAP